MRTPTNSTDNIINPTGDIAMIAAVGPHLELGSHGELIWHISTDLKNFKQLTTGHPVIMGRKTWESLPKRPLPGRLNIVLTRSAQSTEGAETAGSVEEAIAKCDNLSMPFIIGGEQIYRIMMPFATQLFITHVDATTEKDVDAWFPEYKDEWIMDDASEWHTDSNGIKYRFERWIRI